MRKRLGVPRIMRAGAGPRDPGPGGREDGELPTEVQDDSDLDTVSSLFDDDGDDDRSSVTSIDSESDIVIHNTAAVRF